VNNQSKRFPAKYSRAFEWRIAKGDRPSTAQLVGIASLAASEYRDILRDYFEISRKRRTNRMALFKLQLHLLDDLLELEEANKFLAEKA
jgi:hypothetical protein